MMKESGSIQIKYVTEDRIFDVRIKIGPLSHGPMKVQKEVITCGVHILLEELLKEIFNENNHIRTA